LEEPATFRLVASAPVQVHENCLLPSQDKCCPTGLAVTAAIHLTLQYCREVSQQEGMPDSEQCQVLPQSGEGRNCMTGLEARALFSVQSEYKAVPRASHKYGLLNDRTIVRALPRNWSTFVRAEPVLALASTAFPFFGPSQGSYSFEYQLCVENGSSSSARARDSSFSVRVHSSG
jgi:hypothetical protein